MASTAPAVRPLEYSDHIALLRQTDPALADELANFVGIGQVVEWLAARRPGPSPIDSIAQDEFAYDFLLELEPGGRWLAFGVT